MPKVLCQLSLIIVVIKADFVKCSKTLFTLDNFRYVRRRKCSKRGSRKGPPYTEFVLVGWRRKTWFSFFLFFFFSILFFL